MNIILITVLLTIAGICLVAYFTWLGIMSYKLMKFRKKSEGAFKHLERWINDNNNLITKRVDQLEEEIFKSISEVDVRVTTEDEKIYDELNSKIDSRCDKLNDKLEKEIDGIFNMMGKNKYSLDLFDKKPKE